MAPIEFQVTVDSGDPHAQARFWAAALGYDVEDHHELVRRTLDAGHATRDDVVEVDGRLVWRTGAAVREPDTGHTRRVLFMLVPEPKAGKNRVHLDLNVGRDRIEDEVRRLTALGARELHRVDEPHARHVTLADPEGNEFCVQ